MTLRLTSFFLGVLLEGIAKCSLGTDIFNHVNKNIDDVLR